MKRLIPMTATLPILANRKIPTGRSKFSSEESSHPRRLLPIAMAVVVVMVSGAPTVSAQEIDTDTASFVGDVLIDSGSTFGRHVAIRWTRSPSLSVIGANAEQTEAIETAVNHLNDMLEGLDFRIDLIEPDNNDADIRVRVASRDDWPEIVESWEVDDFTEEMPRNYGLFYNQWNADFEIIRSFVLLDSDNLRGRQLKHFALEEITQSLGLPGDSPRFTKSIFYESANGRRHGNVTRLSVLDRKLLRFHYGRIRPGMHAIEIGILMAQHWHEESSGRD